MANILARQPAGVKTTVKESLYRLVMQAGAHTLAPMVGMHK
jgi:hypothetical protein